MSFPKAHVSEFALIRLKSEYNEDGQFESLLKKGQVIQDDWARQHQPFLLEGRPNLSSFYIQHTHPPFLVITAPWESPEGHHEWIQSKENEELFGDLSQRIAQDPGSVILFHVEPIGADIGLQDDMGAPRKHIHLCRITIQPEHREHVEQVYRDIKTGIEGEELSGAWVWAGWRVDKAEGVEDLVVFWSGDETETLLASLFEIPGVRNFTRRLDHIV